MKELKILVCEKLNKIFVPLFLLFISVININAQLIFEDGFESGVLDSNKWNVTWWTDRQLEQGIEPEIVTSPVRAGKYAVKMRAEYNWNNIIEYNRTELQARRKKDGEHHSFFDVDGGEYWIGFSVFIPVGWIVDSEPELIFQLHGNGVGRSPPFAIFIDKNTWEWHVRWQPKRDTVGYGVAGEMTIWKAPYEKGEWVDWVIHAIWSYKEDGFLEIFKNGKSVVKHKGPNCYNDAKGMRGPQTGIYKWTWREEGPSDVNKRTVYLDEFKIGDKHSSYCEVAPNHGIR